MTFVDGLSSDPVKSYWTNYTEDTLTFI